MTADVTAGRADPVAMTPYGTVRGRYEHGIAVFRGIPYGAPPFGPRRFRPPAPPEVARDTELLLGWTSDEYRLWLVPGRLLERLDRLGPVAVADAMARCHCGHEVPRGYRALRPGAGTAEIVGQMVTDHLPRRPLQSLADARAGSSYVYEFAWPSQLPDLGACHALELGFVVDTGDVPESARLADGGAPQDPADAMHGAWVRFAETGDPGWQARDAMHPVQADSAGAGSGGAFRTAGTTVATTAVTSVTVGIPPGKGHGRA